MLVSAWLGSLALVRAGTVEERDPYWQVRAGLENLDGLPLSRADSWGWDPVDTPFTQTSPAWNDVLALGWSTFGFAGIFLVALAALVLYLATVAWIGSRLGARPLPVLVGTLACALPALAMLSPRATVVAQTLFLLGLAAADRWRARAERPTAPVDAAVVLVGAAVLVAAGSWIHLSWLLLAPATVASWAVLWLCGRAVTTARAALLTGASVVGALAGLAVGPYGSDAWRLTQAVQAACQGLVIEWLGVLTPGLIHRWLPAAVLALALAGGAAVWVTRSWPRRRTDQRVGLVGALVVLALPAALGSFSALRFVGVALLALAPVAAVVVTSASDRLRGRAAADPPTGAFRSARVRFWSDGASWRPVLAIVIVLLSPGTVLLAAPLARPLPELAVVDALPRGCRLLSDPSSAGPVLLLRPDVTVWVDGRFDHWGRDRLEAARAALSADTVDVPPLDQAGCVMLSTTDPFAGGSLASALDASPAWDAVGAGSTVRLWVRST